MSVGVCVHATTESSGYCPELLLNTYEGIRNKVIFQGKEKILLNSHFFFLRFF